MYISMLAHDFYYRSGPAATIRKGQFVTVSVRRSDLQDSHFSSLYRLPVSADWRYAKDSGRSLELILFNDHRSAYFCMLAVL